MKAKLREETRKKVKDIRKKEIIPAVLYGHKIKNLNLAVPYSTFDGIFRKASSSSLVDLAIDEKKPVKVIIQSTQRDPLSNRYTHVDFYQVSMTEKIKAKIALKFINEAPAIKVFNGVLVTSIEKIEVSCLPQALVPEIEIDLSTLKTFEDSIHIKDLKVPAGIEILNNPTDIVVNVIPPRAEEVEIKPVAEAAAPAEGEAAAPEAGAAAPGETPAAPKEEKK